MFIAGRARLHTEAAGEIWGRPHFIDGLWRLQK